MRILVTGAAGMLGHDLVPELERLHRVRGVDLENFDIRDPSAVTSFVTAERPELVVHAAAYTNVDAAEQDSSAARAVNALGAANVAAACRLCGARMILISTDYVFSGSKQAPYVESDEPDPVNEYGRSKLEGELLARSELESLTVVRTSWLYGEGGESFPTRILRAARGRKSLRVVDDEIGSPTWAVDFSRALAALIGGGAGRPVYHMAGAGQCSRYEWAVELFRLMGIAGCELVPVPGGQFETTARRPRNSALDTEVPQEGGGRRMRNWKEALAEFVPRMPRTE